MAEHIKIARHINVTATRKSLVLPPMDWDFVTTSVTTLRILAGNIQNNYKKCRSCSGFAP